MNEIEDSDWHNDGLAPVVTGASIGPLSSQFGYGRLRLRLVAVVVSILALTAGLAPGQPPITNDTALVYVDDNAPGDPRPGDPTVSDPLENGSAAHPYDSIQEAIDDASISSTIIVSVGTYRENIHFMNKALTLRSSNPNDPAVVAATVIDGRRAGPVVLFQGDESERNVLSGFKITNGDIVKCCG